MKLRIVLVLTAIAAVCVAVPVLAQGKTSEARFEWGAIGFVRGQTLRASVTNIGSVMPGGVRIEAAILDSDGRLLGQRDPVQVPAGGSRSFDFPRRVIGLDGESPTGRLQVRVMVRVRADPALAPRAMRRLLLQFLPTLEVYDDSTGATSQSGMIGDVRTVISGESGS